MEQIYTFSHKQAVVFGSLLIVAASAYLSVPFLKKKSRIWLADSSRVFTPKRGIDVQEAMDFSFDHIIARYQKDYGVPREQALECERELKRYLILTAEEDRALPMFSTEVDDLWHTFLLFTREYHCFCNGILGHFIHHVPRVDDETDIDTEQII